MVNRILTRVRFRQLRMLIAVGEHRSLLQAAKELNVSQPAATNMIKDLEAEFGVSLIHRSNKGAVPTNHGEVLIKNAKLIVARVSATIQELDDLSGGGSGRVAVGALPAASSQVLPMAIEKTLEKRPNVTIKVVEGTNEVLLPALRSGEIDMILGRLPTQTYHEELEQIKLFREQVVAVVRKGHPLAQHSKLKIEELMQFGWILPPAEAIIRPELNKLFQDHGDLRPTSVVESFSYLTNRRLLLKTDLVALLPAHVAAFDLTEGYLKRVDIALDIGTIFVGISIRKERALSPAARFFLDVLQDVSKDV